MKKQKSWADYDAAIRNVYIKDEDEDTVIKEDEDRDSLKPLDSRKYDIYHY